MLIGILFQSSELRTYELADSLVVVGMGYRVPVTVNFGNTCSSYILSNNKIIGGGGGGGEGPQALDGI